MDKYNKELLTLVRYLDKIIKKRKELFRMKKILIFVSLIVFCIVPLNIFAESDIGISKDCIVVEVETTEQKEELIEKIKEHNEITEKLWEEASLREVKNYTYEIEGYINMNSQSLKVVTLRGRSFIQELFSPIRYDYVGSYYSNGSWITSFKSLRVFPGNSDNIVSLLDYQVKVLDNARTNGVTAAVRVGIYNKEDSKWYYQSVNNYMEFYANGGGAMIN